MEEPTLLSRALSKFGDILLVGLYSSLASLGIVTLAAAWGAAQAVLGRPGHSGTSGAWLDEFRSRLRPGIPLSIVLAISGLIVAVDVVFALSDTGALVSVVVLGAGTALFSAGAVLLPHLLARTSVVGIGKREIVRDAAALAMTSPLISAGLVGLAALTTLAVLAALPLAPAFHGISAWVGALVHRTAMTALRIRLSAPSPR